jgi:hypothetical protein
MSVRSIPAKFYKYRRFEVPCLRVLTHFEIRYSDPRYFNDPLDCNPTITIDVDRNALEQLCYRFLLRTKSKAAASAVINRYRHISDKRGASQGLPKVEDCLKRMLVERVKCELDRELDTKGIFSLSERWDSALMWSHYADYHRGLCIEFETDEPPSTLRPVNYRGLRSIRASDLVAWKQGSAEAKSRVFDTYFYAKAGPWRYEKEWRDLHDTNGIEISGFLVTGIYFGFRCDRAVLLTVVKLLASDHNVTLYEIYLPNDGFGLKKRLVDRDEIERTALTIPTIGKIETDVPLPEGAEEWLKLKSFKAEEPTLSDALPTH